MTQPGLVVIGSGPAGVSAAEEFRAHNADAPVQILTADLALPYARPPLSKDYLRGETEDVALHPAQWYDDRSIELIDDLCVDRIDVQSRTVITGDSRFDYRAGAGLRRNARRTAGARRGLGGAAALVD